MTKIIIVIVLVVVVVLVERRRTSGLGDLDDEDGLDCDDDGIIDDGSCLLVVDFIIITIV